MPHRTFITFIWPSVLAMLLFIALPVVSVGIQSLHIQHEQIVQTVKNCGPFGCKEVEIVDTESTALLQKEQPLGRFNVTTGNGQVQGIGVERVFSVQTGVFFLAQPLNHWQVSIFGRQHQGRRAPDAGLVDVRSVFTKPLRQP